MYCRNCGTELDENVKFCPNCGEPVQDTVQHHSTTTAEVVEDKPPKVWSVFSVVGKVLGIVCLATSLIPFLNYISLELGIVGIVLSCLGKKAKTEEAYKNCSLGLKLSIAAVAVSVVTVIVYEVLMGVGFGLLYEYYYTYPFPA